MNESGLIEIEGVSYGYPGGALVFKGFDFTLQRGERVGLVGQNGRGKTTLKHLIMGLVKPTSGEVRVLGRSRRTEGDFYEVRCRVGLMFQDSEDQLFCPTVEEDIAFGPLNLGASHGEAERLVGEVCWELGIESIRRSVTHKLSGGQKRMVAFATVAAMRPECYLLDEPTAGLDAEHVERLSAYLDRHATSVLISSHDRNFIDRHTERLVTL